MKHLFDLFLAERQLDTIRCCKLSYEQHWVVPCSQMSSHMEVWTTGKSEYLSCALSGNCLHPYVNCCTECNLTTV